LAGLNAIDGDDYRYMSYRRKSVKREPMMQVLIECGTFGHALEAEDVLLLNC